MRAEVIKKEVLLMLSGGRDSFLAACRLISKDYHIHLVTYDNGYMSGCDYAVTVAERIQRRFGEDNVDIIGVQTIAPNIRPMLERILYSETLDLCRDYPNLLISQVHCLVCHTAMYAHSIAYCIANDISVIAEGARKEQKFFVELPEMKDRYEKLCKKYEIDLLMPVYDLKSDVERKTELAEWGFLPKTCEPQCWLGCPMLGELTPEQKKSLALYYDKEIDPLIDQMIEKLVSKKKKVNKRKYVNQYE